MKDKRGFTLVELLGTIVLIALVTTVIATPIVSQISKMSGKVDEATLKLLYASTETYMKKHSNTYQKNDGTSYYITINELMNADLLTDDFLEAYSEEILSLDTQIKVTVENKKYTYEIPETQADNILEVYESMNTTDTYQYAGGTYIKGNANNNYDVIDVDNNV